MENSMECIGLAACPICNSRDGLKGADGKCLSCRIKELEQQLKEVVDALDSVSDNFPVGQTVKNIVAKYKGKE